MKRITLILAAIICLAITAMAQLNADQPLSPTLWKQGIATCAHYPACDRRFGKRIEEIKAQYPQGYTLDNLNDIYSGQGRKWEKIYKEFKEQENKGGSLNDLKALVTPQIWRLVEPDIQAFVTDHPEIANEVPSQPEDQQSEGDNDNAEVKQEDNANEAAPVKTNNVSEDKGTSCPVNLPLWLGILGSLLGLCSLLIALSNRGKIKEMGRTFAREIDRTNANLQEFSTDAADQMKALSIRLTGKAVRNTEIEPVAEQPIEEPVQEEEVQETVVEEEPQQEEEDEILNLFLSRPDDNDDFTRVSDTFEPGNSIYVLTTFDGQHGTFEVIDKPEVHRFALMMPAENLIHACSGNAIQIPSGTRIVTDRAGEAEFIDGKWHVIVKAIIHYEG